MKDATPDSLHSATKLYFLVLRFLGSATLTLVFVLTVFWFFFPGNMLSFGLKTPIPLVAGFCSVRFFQEQQRAIGTPLTFSFLFNRACSLLLIFWGGSTLAILTVLLVIVLLFLVGFGEILLAYSHLILNIYFFSTVAGAGGLGAFYIWFINRPGVRANP